MFVKPFCCMVQRLSAIISLLFFAAGAGAQTDSLYIKSYYENLVPRFLYNYKVQFTSFITRLDSLYSVDYFSTGSQNFVGADLGYKWMTLGYNVSFNKENTRANTDLRFSTSYKPLSLQMNYTSLKNLNYYRVNGRKEQDTMFAERQHHIVLQNIGLRLEYVFNYKKFCYSTAFSQGGRQLKSQGSFICSSSMALQDFDLRGLSDTSGLLFFDRFISNRVRSTRIDLGAGYAYNWVIGKNLVLSVSEIPNLGFQKIVTSLEGSYSFPYPSVSFTNYVRAGLIYTRSRLFAGAYIYNAYTASRWLVYQYSNAYTSVQLYAGMVLDAPRWKRGRKGAEH